MKTYTCRITGRTWDEAGPITKHSRCPFCACRGCVSVPPAPTLDQMHTNHGVPLAGMLAEHAAAKAAALAEGKANTDAAVDPIAAARATLEAAGWEVTRKRVGGYEDAPVVLAHLLAWATMSEHDANRWLDERPSSHMEIARLRALGVTPAVLK